MVRTPVSSVSASNCQIVVSVIGFVKDWLARGFILLQAAVQGCFHSSLIFAGRGRILSGLGGSHVLIGLDGVAQLPYHFILIEEI